MKLPELNHAKGCQTAAEPWLQLPDLNHPKGIQTRRDSLAQWMQALAARLRGVRVCCGDWQRICGDSPTIHCATPVAVFLDPPYDVTRRDKEIYAQDAPGLAAAVREWALNRGDDPRFRIALCGLEGEHPMPPSWECLAWKAGGGYANMHQTKGRGLTNRHRERVWFSPHCFRPELAGVTMAGLGRVANEASE